MGGGARGPKAEGMAHAEKILFPGRSCVKFIMCHTHAVCDPQYFRRGERLKLWLAIVTSLVVEGVLVRNEYKCDNLEISTHRTTFLPVQRFVPLKSHPRPFLH